MKREATGERRQGPHTVRLKLECACGRSQTLWVDPDAPVRAVAQAHGWGLHVGYWEHWRPNRPVWICPECLKKEDG